MEPGTTPISIWNGLLKIQDHFATIRPRYTEFLSNITGVDTEIFTSQIPGGMISNMESQLKQQGAADKVKEVLLEVPEVRRTAGYPPLVTPSSQIVGTQAVFNVLMGRYKVITAEFADLMLGYYGSTLGERDPEVMARCEKQAKKTPIMMRPADLLKPEWEQLRTTAIALDGCDGSDEDVSDLRDVSESGAEIFLGTGKGTKERGQGSEYSGERHMLLQRTAEQGQCERLSNTKLNWTAKSTRVTVSPA